jgi:hypothetical protein
MRRADGTLTKVRLAGSSAPAPAIAVTLTPGRHGVVSWFSQPVAGGSVGGPPTVSTVALNSHGNMGGLKPLDPGTAWRRPTAPARGARLRAVLGPDGSTTFAWTGFAGGHYVVRAERLYRDIGDQESLSPPGIDAQLMDLTTDAAGDVLAVWATAPDTAPVPGVAAVIRPAGAPPGAPPSARRNSCSRAPTHPAPRPAPSHPAAARSSPAARSRCLAASRRKASASRGWRIGADARRTMPDLVP